MAGSEIQVHGGHFGAGSMVKTEDFLSRDVDGKDFMSPTSAFSMSSAGGMMAHGMRPKRKQVKNACVNCQKACKKCDEGRPCTRCIKYGLTDSCQDSLRKERKRGIKRGPYKRRATTGSQPNLAATGVQLSPGGHHAAHSDSSGYGYSHSVQHHYPGHQHHASLNGSQPQPQPQHHAHYQHHGSNSSTSPYEHSYGSQSPEERSRSLEDGSSSHTIDGHHQHGYQQQQQQQQHHFHSQQQHTQHPSNNFINSPVYSSASAPGSVQRGTAQLAEVKQEPTPSPSMYARETMMQPPSRAFAPFDRSPSALYSAGSNPGASSSSSSSSTANGRSLYGSAVPVSAPASTVGFGVPGRSATSLGFGTSSNGGTPSASSLSSMAFSPQQQQQQQFGMGHHRLHSDSSLANLSYSNSSHSASAHSLSPRTPLSLGQTSGSGSSSNSSLLYPSGGASGSNGELGLMSAPFSAGSSGSSPGGLGSSAGAKMANSVLSSSYVHHPVPTTTGSGLTPGSFLGSNAASGGSFNLHLPQSAKLRGNSTSIDARVASSSPRPQHASQQQQRSSALSSNGQDDGGKDELAPIKEPSRYQLPSPRFATGSGAHAVEYKARSLKAETSGGDELVGLGAA